MIVNIDAVQLFPLIKAFYELTKIKIAVYDNQFHEILTYPERNGDFCTLLEKRPHLRKKCDDCDAHFFSECAQRKETIIYKCHAGLTEVVSPLTDNGITMGYVVCGQITHDPDRNRFISDVLRRCAQYGISPDMIKESLRKVRFYSQADLVSTLQIINALTSYIVLKKWIYISEKPLGIQLIDYIEKNLSADLSIAALCKQFAISKSELYNQSKTYMPEGIAKFIRWRRIEAAQKSIEANPHKPLWQIAGEAGFDNYAYFLRTFKAQTGISAASLQKSKKG